MTMPRLDYIIHVHLNGGGDYYFGCVKAIYTLLDDEQVGCRLPDIYKHGLPYSTEKATIQRGEVVRMPQSVAAKTTME